MIYDIYILLDDMKRRYRIPYILALIASHIMCIVVAYNYASLLSCVWCSAPANLAFVYLIPFGIFIIICVVVWYFLQNKYINNTKSKK